MVCHCCTACTTLPPTATNKIIYQNMFKFSTEDDKGMTEVSMVKEFFFFNFISFSSWSIIENSLWDMILYHLLKITNPPPKGKNAD
jgi:hypothetical protein